MVLMFNLQIALETVLIQKSFWKFTRNILDIFHPFVTRIPKKTCWSY